MDLLGVRSLADASRARQFNPLNRPLNDLNPYGVGWVPLPQTNMAAVVGRARSCVRDRSCVVVCAVGRAWSCAIVRGRSCVVVRGRAWSCVVGRARSCTVVRAWSVVRGRARRSSRPTEHCRAARFAANHCAWACLHGGTNERTTSNNPPGVGWVNFFYHIKVRVSMGTCVPNLGAIRQPVRKKCPSSL